MDYMDRTEREFDENKNNLVWGVTCMARTELSRICDKSGKKYRSHSEVNTKRGLI